MEFDEVTGAPRFVNTSRPRSWTGPPAGYHPPALAPHGYSYSGYIPGPYLTPTPSPGRRSLDLPPSPVLMPTQWQSAYIDVYGRSPYQNTVPLAPDLSPRHPTVPLYDSPYTQFIPLPALPNERYERPRETWATRLWEYLNIERDGDPHRQFVQEVNLHEALIKRRSRINWVVHAPPHTIRVLEPPDPYASAFSPELTRCRIVSPLLPWAIEIKAHRGQRCITIISLLGDIHKALSKGIDRTFYEGLPSDFREEINHAFHNRASAIQDTEAANRALERGIQRSDFLLDKVKYGGLKQIKSLIYTFELELEKL